MLVLIRVELRITGHEYAKVSRRHLLSGYIFRKFSLTPRLWNVLAESAIAFVCPVFAIELIGLFSTVDRSLLNTARLTDRESDVRTFDLHNHGVYPYRSKLLNMYITVLS